MAQKNPEFQPGAILHEVIVGAFRARGTSFERWCAENGIPAANARNATFGQSRGATGQGYLERIIDGAGADFVRDAYRRRLAEHFSQVTKGAA